MEWPRWAAVFLLIYLSYDVANVFCQNIPLERISPDFSAQLLTETTQVQSPSKAQLINALFSYATDKGLLPKTTQLIQSPLPQERPQITNQNTPTLLNVVPAQSQVSFDFERKPILSNIPAVTINPYQIQVPQPTTNAYSEPMKLQPTTLTNDPVSWAFTPKVCQGCFENCACSQPPQTLWQIPQYSQPFNIINNGPANQPVVYNQETLPCINPPFNPTGCIYSPINTECTTFENNYLTNCGTRSEESVLVTCDDKPGIPINLQINIPSPNELLPSITIVTPTIPEPAVAFSPYKFPPPPPIIMKRSRSSLRKMLPIILLALIDHGRNCGGCCCPSNCDCDNPVPVPFPIPIPVNMPIIN